MFRQDWRIGKNKGRPKDVKKGKTNAKPKANTIAKAKPKAKSGPKAKTKAKAQMKKPSSSNTQDPDDEDDRPCIAYVLACPFS